MSDPRVSVIVPVYDPGPYLERCIDSLLAQTMPPGQLELIFVDDGSTDGSGERLDRLAAEHPHVRVIHQENSGWPGRPRNVGIDAARGEYLFFADHDDVLGPEALERMVAFADRSAADVVVPRTVSTYGEVNHDLFASDRVVEDVWAAPLLDSPTPHKLVRRSLVEEHHVRFPEGRRPLEDFIFVLQAFFLARRIGIVGSYDAYFHLRRDDGANAWLSDWDPLVYAASVREAIAIVEAHVEPGPRRDRLLERFARAEIAGRFRAGRLLRRPEEDRQRIVAGLAAVARDHLPASVDAAVPPLQRVVLALLRQERLDLLESFAVWDRDVREHATGVVDVTAPTVAFDITAELGRDGRPIVVDDPDHGLLLDVPPEVAAAVPAMTRALGAAPHPAIRAFLRREGDRVETPLPVTMSAQVGGIDPLGVARARVTLDPDTALRGGRLDHGRWAVLVRLSQAGHEATLPIVLDPARYPTPTIVRRALGDRDLAVARTRETHRLKVDVRRPVDRRLHARILRRGRRLLARFPLPRPGRRT